MFSGIVQKTGKLVHRHREGTRFVLTLETDPWPKPLKRGESISVNGACLTVVTSQRRRFTVDEVSKTLAATTLGNLRLREQVNLERSLKWGERIGGHFVLGHVDGVGQIVRRKVQGKDLILDIEVPSQAVPLLVPKGSIAVDGISLTVQKISARVITIAVIPHTAKHTTL